MRLREYRYHPEKLLPGGEYKELWMSPEGEDCGKESGREDGAIDLEEQAMWKIVEKSI